MIAHEKPIADKATDIFGASLSRRGFVKTGGALLVGFGLVNADAMQNVGGARPGEMDRATQGWPGKYSFCCAENEDASPWEPLHVERGRPGCL